MSKGVPAADVGQPPVQSALGVHEVQVGVDQVGSVQAGTALVGDRGAVAGPVDPQSLPWIGRGVLFHGDDHEGRVHSYAVHLFPAPGVHLRHSFRGGHDAFSGMDDQAPRRGQVAHSGPAGGRSEGENGDDRQGRREGG